MAEKKQVRLTGPNGTVVRLSDEEAKRSSGWKPEKPASKPSKK